MSDYAHLSRGNGGSNSGRTPPLMRTARGSQLYMGDIETSWDEDTIVDIWHALGEANVRVKMMWANQQSTEASQGVQRNNQGYCFVEFPSPAHASKALLKDGVQVPNFPHKKMKLNWATQSMGSGNMLDGGYSTVNNPRSLSVFVGDLAPTVTEAQLFDLFINVYPSTLHAKVLYDQNTGVSKGYGFVKFADATEQNRALHEMQGVYLNGRAIKVGSATNSQRNQQVQGGSQNHGPMLQSTRMLEKDITSHLPHSSQRPILNHFTDANNTTVFIGGLSSLVTELELRSYFEPFGTIIYVKIPTGKGCGFVQYMDRISAETAIVKMQGYMIGNSRIRLSWGRSARQTAIIQQALQNNAVNHSGLASNSSSPMQINMPIVNGLSQTPITYGSNPVPIATGMEKLPMNYGGLEPVPSNGQAFNAMNNLTGNLLPGYQNMYTGPSTNVGQIDGITAVHPSQNSSMMWTHELANPSQASIYSPDKRANVYIQTSSGYVNSQIDSVNRLNAAATHFSYV